jgi:outer membrane protein assembly factor BamB
VFGYLDGVYCFDPPAPGQSAPTQRWVYPTGLVLSSPAVSADDTVFIGSSDGNLYAIDGKSGQLRFAVAVGSAVNSSPAIGSDGAVYFSADDGNLWSVR